MLSAAVRSAARHLKLPRGWHASPPIQSTHFSVPDDAGSTIPFGLTPDQIRNAYGLGTYGSSAITFNGIQGDGSGQTIAIIDAYDDPNALSDLQQFDAVFGLPDLVDPGSGISGPTFQKVSQYGTNVLPGTDPVAGSGKATWELEESIDIEWAHVMAPRANIVLYEAIDSGDGLYTAIQSANTNSSTSVISMSWGGAEFSGENAYDGSRFSTPGITYVAATGDTGGALQYPASSPNVVAVGGTTLSLTDNAYASESAWHNGGGGISSQEAQPAYQRSTNTGSTTFRTTPDVSMDADPSTGVSIYDSFDFGSDTPWCPGYEGGTSLSAPLFAGIIAVADQGHVTNGLSTFSGKSQVLPALYALPGSDYHDIITGSNGHDAKGGYDLATGIGSPIGNVLIRDLAGTAVVTGKAFVDNNGNGLLDELETVLANKFVYLDQNNDGLQQSTEPKTTTSATGVYTFANRTAGGTVRLSAALAGYVSVPPPTVAYAATNTINVTVFPTSFSTTTASQNYTLQTDSTGATTQILINGSPTYSVSTPVISSAALTFNLIGVGDSFTVNGSNANPIPSGGIALTGATSGDVLNVIGTTRGNDAFSVTSNSIGFGSSLISFSHVTSVLLNPGMGINSLAVDSGSVTVAARSDASGILNRNFSNVSIAVGATALFATAPLHADRMLIQVTSLSILGKLDLGGNDLIVHNADVSTLTSQIKSGFANGAWNGVGINSSAASVDSAHMTALAVMQNSLYGSNGQPLFDGVAPLNTDVLVKYTYYGDANFDGKVDDSDYSRIDSAYLLASTGWFNGDFNFDGVLNGSDFTLIDNAFNTQGNPL